MPPLILIDNRFADGTPVASGTAAGFDARHIADTRPFTFWRAPAVGTYTIKVDSGSAKVADALALCGHNLASIGATVSVESSPDNAAWTTRLAAFAPASDYALLRTFASATVKWWRITIIAPAGIPELAVCFIGARLTLPAPPDAPYIPCEQDSEEESPISEGGFPLATAIKFKPIRTKPSFSNLPRAWVFDTFRPVWEDYLSNRSLFFWAWDLATYPNDFVYLAQHVGKYAPGVSILTLADKLDLDLRCWR